LILFIWPLVLLYKTRKIKDPFLFGAGVMPSFLFQLWYNYHFTGNAFDMLYNHQAIDFYNDPNTFIGFALPIPEAMWQLLIGVFRGWFTHAPVVLLFILMIIKQTIKTPKMMLFDYLLPLIIASWLLFSSYRVWYGGWCFGPRHFIPLTVLLLYHFAKYMDWKEWKNKVFYAVCITGIIYTWMAKCTLLYSINAEYKFPLVDLLIPSMKNDQFNENNILTLTTGINAGISAFAWLMILFAGCLVLYRKSIRRKTFSFG
jgi:hypothetical protein